MAPPALPGWDPALELPTEAAFRAILPELEALAPQDLASINVEVMRVVVTTLACLPRLRTLRPEFAQHLSTFDLERFDKLEQYTLALAHTDFLQRSAVRNQNLTAQLGPKVIEARDHLLDDARTLSRHGFIHPERLKACTKSTSHRLASSHVLTLICLFKEHWSVIEGRTAVTLASLNEAGRKAQALIVAAGGKEQARRERKPHPAQLMRQRAYTLFFNTYGDIRRAVVYLRRKQRDANTFAPPLIVGRAGRGKSNPAVMPEAKAAPPQSTLAEGASNAPVQFSNPHNLPVDFPFVA